MEQQERPCYQYFCEKFPRCRRAGGRGCAMPAKEYKLPDGQSSQVQLEECNAENEYALFEVDPTARIFIHRESA